MTTGGGRAGGAGILFLDRQIRWFTHRSLQDTEAQGRDGRLAQHQWMGTNQHCFRHLPGTKGVVGNEVQLDLEKIKDYFKQEMAEAAAPDDVSSSHFSMALTDHQSSVC